MNEPTAYLPLDAARAAYAQASEETGVSVDELLTERPSRRVAHARWRVMQIMRERRASLPMIALRMGMHHTAVLYGLRKIEGGQ